MRYVHPAFELTIYPSLALLGFLILAVSTVVIVLGLGRLNEELRASVSSRVARHRADTARHLALGRGLLLGVVQMRRRPWRSALTCLTLVLLTFSLLSFTSVRAAIRYNQTHIGTGAGRDALLLRLPGWEGIVEITYDHLRLRFGPASTLPRAWYLQEGLVKGTDGRRVKADAVLGMTAGEEGLSGVDSALSAGRWFAPGEQEVCILSEGQAAALGVQEKDMGKVWVRFLGADYRVIGKMDSRSFDDLKDISGGPLTPLDPQAQQPREEEAGWGRGGVEEAFVHMSSSHLLLLLPYEVVRRWG